MKKLPPGHLGVEEGPPNGTKRLFDEKREKYFGCEPMDDKRRLIWVCLLCEGCEKWFTVYFREKEEIPLHWRRRLTVPTCQWCSDTALEAPTEQVQTSRWPPNPYLHEYLSNPASNLERNPYRKYRHRSDRDNHGSCSRKWTR